MNLDETDKIELKQTFNGSLVKEIVAFLNGEGGTVFIGIKRDKTIIGIPNVDIDEIQRKISDVITDQISPRCVEYVHQHKESMEGKDIIQIDVDKGPKFYCIKKYGYSEIGCPVRNGSSCKRLRPEEIEKRFIDSLHIPEPNISLMPARRQDLSFRILKNYLEGSRFHFDNKTLEQNLHLRLPDGRYNYLAEILSDENDIVITVATFASKDKTVYLKRDEYGGKCLLLAMEQAKNYVEAINQTYVKVGNGARKEKKMFDQEAFEQAWYNACVHNKWAEANNPGIYIYSNRLEVESHGGIPKLQTKESFLAGISKPVNPELFSVFKTCGFGEESGHGVPTVINAYGEGAFQFSDHVIDVAIPFERNEFINAEKDQNILTETTTRKTTTKTTRKDCGKKDQNAPSLTRTRILELLRTNPSLTCEYLAKILKITKDGVRYHLNKLIQTGMVFRLGGRKNGEWQIANKETERDSIPSTDDNENQTPEDAVKQAPKKVQESVQEKVQENTTTTKAKTGTKIMNLLMGNPRLTGSDLSLILGLSKATIQYWLRRLQKDGLISRVGPDKGGYWAINSRKR